MPPAGQRTRNAFLHGPIVTGAVGLVGLGGAGTAGRLVLGVRRMVERTGPRAAFEQFGTLLYLTCVDFMLRLGALLGLSYRDTNALVLLVGVPAVVGPRRSTEPPSNFRVAAVTPPPLSSSCRPEQATVQCRDKAVP